MGGSAMAIGSVSTTSASPKSPQTDADKRHVAEQAAVDRYITEMIRNTGKNMTFGKQRNKQLDMSSIYDLAEPMQA